MWPRLRIAGGIGTEGYAGYVSQKSHTWRPLSDKYNAIRDRDLGPASVFCIDKRPLRYGRGLRQQGFA